MLIIQQKRREMKKILLPAFLLLVSTVVLINGCEKDEDPCLNPFDTVSGIVSSEYEFGACVSTLGMLNQDYVIEDEATFNSLAALPSDHADCGNSSIQSIDFERYSLLGLYADGSCDVIFDRNVEQDVKNKKYIYTVSRTLCSNCERHEYSMNWVLVPKLPTGYVVEFRTI